MQRLVETVTALQKALPNNVSHHCIKQSKPPKQGSFLSKIKQLIINKWLTKEFITYQVTEHDQMTNLNVKETRNTAKIKLQHNSFHHLSILGSARKLARGKAGYSFQKWHKVPMCQQLDLAFNFS